MAALTNSWAETESARYLQMLEGVPMARLKADRDIVDHSGKEALKNLTARQGHRPSFCLERAN
jgi:hypothetical protein